MLLPGIGGKIIGAALDKKKSKKSDKMMKAKIMQLEQRIAQLEGRGGVGGPGRCCSGSSGFGSGLNININAGGVAPSAPRGAGAGYMGFRAPGFCC